MDIYSFGSSDSLSEVEQGLKELDKVANQIVLAYGMALLRIEEGGLWAQSGAPTLRVYQRAHFRQLGLPKSTVSTRRAIARGYMDNLDVLKGRDVSNRLSNLVDLSRARKNHGDEAALAHFWKDDWRAWIKFARA